MILHKCIVFCFLMNHIDIKRKAREVRLMIQWCNCWHFTFQGCCDLVLGLGESLCCKNGVQQSFLSGEVLK